jgi:hypothetical protein
VRAQRCAFEHVCWTVSFRSDRTVAAMARTMLKRSPNARDTPDGSIVGASSIATNAPPMIPRGGNVMKKALALLPLLLLAAGARSADAGGNVGGHVGMAVSLVGFTGDNTGLFRTSVIGDGTTHLAYPIGITLQKTPRLAIDWEMVISSPSTTLGATTLTIDPGIVYKWDGFNTGLRLSMNIGAKANYGLIPLISKGWMIAPHVKWFLEGDLPLVYDVDTRATAINAVLHSGIGF